MSSKLASFCTLNAHSELGAVDKKYEQERKDDLDVAPDTPRSETAQSPCTSSVSSILDRMASLQVKPTPSRTNPVKFNKRYIGFAGDDFADDDF